MENHWRRQILPIMAVVVFGLAGCGGGSGGGASPAGMKSLRHMTGMYDEYRREHQGQAPPDEQAFREFLNSQQDGLQQKGLSVDKMFLSPYSGVPLQWVYGMTPPKDFSGRLTYVAYEKTPVDGKRLVIGTNGLSERMDDVQFREVFPNGL